MGEHWIIEGGNERTRPGVTLSLGDTFDSFQPPARLFIQDGGHNMQSAHPPGKYRQAIVNSFNSYWLSFLSV